ncbi:MAG: class I SAM-dependent methyltransferase [Methanotrichaceae archaeon]|nr:class I SAM-dependent methyltransferase [Methanotrichaceae archaeon]
MNGYSLNKTDGYHKYELDSLKWEITLSVMLEDPGGPCRSVLVKSDSFGNLLYDFIATVIPMDRVRYLIEIGGGYGYLMRDFLKRNKMLSATMVDLSSFLLERQRETLQEFAVKFVLGDFFEMDDSILSNIDLVILNEVIGDFPTICQVPRNVLLESSDPVDSLLREVRRIYESYEIAIPVAEHFTVNLGAIQALEKLCKHRIPYIYVSEHSCETRVPERMMSRMELRSTGEPERIKLRGHDEYTIRFSDLERIAASFGYASKRGQYFDFIEPVIEGEVSLILCLDASRTARQEIIGQFVADLVKYEYLILILPTQ